MIIILTIKFFKKLFFQIILKEFCIQKKKLKTSNNITKYLDNFSWKTNSTNFITSKLKKNSLFFKILLNFNKYLFDRKIFTTRKFFSLNLKLRNLPFSTEDFFRNLYFKFLDKIQNRRIDEKNLIRKKLILRKKDFQKINLRIFYLILYFTIFQKFMLNIFQMLKKKLIIF